MEKFIKVIISIADVFCGLIWEFVVSQIIGTKKARVAYKQLKASIPRMKIRKETDGDGGYIVTLRRGKKDMEFHISREGTVRDYDLAESLGYIW